MRAAVVCLVTLCCLLVHQVSGFVDEQVRSGQYFSQKTSEEPSSDGRPVSGVAGGAPGAAQQGNFSQKTLEEPPPSGPVSDVPGGAPGAAQQGILNATVADVNHQHNTVKLKMQAGETVELKVPKSSLPSLKKGDSVEVSIRKAERQQDIRTKASSGKIAR